MGKMIYLSDKEQELLYSILAVYTDDTEDETGKELSQIILDKIG